MKKFVIFLLVFFISCGYKSVSVITENSIGENVFVDVNILKSDPENSVAIKDGIREAVIKRLGRDLSDKDNASTIIIANIENIVFTPTSYDKYGFINAYEAQVFLNYQVRFNDGKIAVFKASGTSNFRMSEQIQNTFYTNSVISKQDRYDAIYKASKESFDELIAKLALHAERMKNGKSNQ